MPINFSFLTRTKYAEVTCASAYIIIQWRNRFGSHFCYGPATRWANGNLVYRQNDYLHRTDGPAVILHYGKVEYRINGELHRIDGPAVMDDKGHKAYYLKGIYMTKDKWEEKRKAQLKTRQNAI